MDRYMNLGRDSNVAAYEAGSDRISVQFNDGSVYLYTYRSSGQANVEQMKKLAQAGRGLNAFINTSVRKSYESKVR